MFKSFDKGGIVLISPNDLKIMRKKAKVQKPPASKVRNHRYFVGKLAAFFCLSISYFFDPP